MYAKKIKADLLTVWAKDLTTGSRFTFKVYEFTNALILSPNDSCSDEWFEFHDKIEASGDSVVMSIESEETEVEFSEKELLHSFLGSAIEYGFSKLPTQKFLALLLAFHEDQPLEHN